MRWNMLVYCVSGEGVRLPIWELRRTLTACQSHSAWLYVLPAFLPEKCDDQSTVHERFPLPVKLRCCTAASPLRKLSARTHPRIHAFMSFALFPDPVCGRSLAALQPTAYRLPIHSNSTLPFDATSQNSTQQLWLQPPLSAKAMHISPRSSMLAACASSSAPLLVSG